MDWLRRAGKNYKPRIRRMLGLPCIDTGRANGDANELPLLTSLPEGLQQTIRAYSSLAGRSEHPEAVGSQVDKGSDCGYRERFSADLNEETRLNIMAYIQEANGAPGKQRLTMNTDVKIRALMSIPLG